MKRNYRQIIVCLILILAIFQSNFIMIIAQETELTPKTTSGAPTETKETQFIREIKDKHKQRLYNDEIYMNRAIFLNNDGTVTVYIFKNTIKYIDVNGNVVDMVDGKIICPEIGFQQPLNESQKINIKTNETNKNILDLSDIKEFNSTQINSSTLYINTDTGFYEKQKLNNDFMILNAVNDADYIIEIEVTPMAETLPAGTYFFKNTTVGRYLDMNNNVFTWNFSGTNTQVWRITRNFMGYYSFYNIYANKYMYLKADGYIGSNSSNVTNYTIDGTASVGYRIIPYSYRNSICPENSTNGSLIHINYQYAPIWKAEEVTTFGCAGSYRYTSSKNFRCYPYSLRLTSNLFIDFNYSDNLDTLTNKTIASINDLSNRSARLLEGDMAFTSYIRPTEYRIALRIGEHRVYDPVDGIYKLRLDYHFMEQLRDGTWAHKPGISPSKNDINDPEVDAWNLYYGDGSIAYNGFYDSDIIYIAVTITS